MPAPCQVKEWTATAKFGWSMHNAGRQNDVAIKWLTQICFGAHQTVGKLVDFVFITSSSILNGSSAVSQPRRIISRTKFPAPSEFSKHNEGQRVLCRSILLKKHFWTKFYVNTAQLGAGRHLLPCLVL